MKNRYFSSLLLLSVAVLMFSCKKEASKWQGTIEEVEGVVVVKNPNEPQYVDYEIKFMEDLSIGVGEG